MPDEQKEIDEERRKFVRISCRLEIKANVEKKWFILNSKAIGNGGMALITESDENQLKKLGIDVGKEVVLSFYLPTVSDLIKVLGKVVYINRNMDHIEEKEFSFIGVKFVNLPNYIKELLEKYIIDQPEKPLL